MVYIPCVNVCVTIIIPSLHKNFCTFQFHGIIATDFMKNIISTWTTVRQPGNSTARKFEIVELPCCLIQSAEDRKLDKNYFCLTSGCRASGMSNLIRAPTSEMSFWLSGGC